MKKHKDYDDSMETEQKKGKGAHEIPSYSVKIVGVGTTDDGRIMIATLSCFCSMEQYSILDVCLKHEKYQQSEVTEHDP